MIVLDHVTKRYGERVAVDDLTFSVEPGVVTGFLGPNGAGKSTTMRMILGLDKPTSGTASVYGHAFAKSKSPLAEIGALLDPKAMQPGRTAYHHLLAFALANGISRQRVHEVLDLVGLTSVAKQRAGGFSLGMGQRLGIATALLGDPRTVILDEPVNGLDPEGIVWVRGLLSELARDGRTVFVSSHLISELSLVAERLIIIGKGKLIADVTVEELLATSSNGLVDVKTTEPERLQRLIAGEGISVTTTENPEHLEIIGLTAREIGAVTAHAGIPLYALIPQKTSLEDVFMALTRDSREFIAADNRGATSPASVHMAVTPTTSKIERTRRAA